MRVVLEPLLQDAPRPGVPQVVDEPRAVDELDLAASTPMTTARWVFPTPGLPTSRTFSARSMNPRVEISSRSGRGTDGWNVQSKSASVFTHGRPEERILSLVILSVLAPASTWVISATARARSAPLRHGDPYLPARHRHRPGLPAYASAGYRPLPARRPDQHRRGHDLLGDVADVDVQ